MTHATERYGRIFRMAAETPPEGTTAERLTRAPAPGIYPPMPELGTMLECWFCHFMVTLRRVPSGRHYWVADRDPLDGRRHCDGGQPARNRNDHALLTLHLPVPAPDGTQRAWWYTRDGEGRSA